MGGVNAALWVRPLWFLWGGFPAFQMYVHVLDTHKLAVHVANICPGIACLSSSGPYDYSVLCPLARKWSVDQRLCLAPPRFFFHV